MYSNKAIAMRAVNTHSLVSFVSRQSSERLVLVSRVQSGELLTFLMSQFALSVCEQMRASQR